MSDLFKQKSIQYAFGPTLQWNILNYGQITNNVRFQDARFQQLIADYQNQVLVAQREVEDALIGFLDSRRSAERQAKAAEAARRSVELAFLQYQEGITDFTTVLTAQQDLLTAQNQLAVFLGDIPLNLVNVYQAMGGGWQLREGNDFVPPAVQQVMRQRTDWGNLLTPVNLLRPTAPGLPFPRDRGPLVRAPEF
jgi:outer membrane protein TolC